MTLFLTNKRETRESCATASPARCFAAILWNPRMYNLKGWRVRRQPANLNGTRSRNGDVSRKRKGTETVEKLAGTGEKLQAQFGPVHIARVVFAQDIREEKILARWHGTMSGVLFIAFK